MWPFSKVKKVEQSMPKYKLAYRKIKVSVGCTDVIVTFEDDTEFRVRRYGHAEQYVNANRYSPEGPIVSPVEVVSSLTVACNMLINLRNNSSTFVDDERNISCCRYGDPVGAYIGETTEYEEIYNEAYLEEIKYGS